MSDTFIQATQNTLSALFCRFCIKNCLHYVASNILKSLNNSAALITNHRKLLCLTTN